MNEFPLLTRDPIAQPAAPTRIVHIGLGAFHRSHQAWYTAHASDAKQWGIAAFTGRRPDAAEQLSAQGCVYTLVTRAATGDSYEVIDSIVSAHDGADTARLSELLAADTTAIVTLTITENAYHLGADSHLAVNSEPVRADLAALAAGEAPATALGRLVYGLAARRASGAGPLAVVSCDNLADNGTLAGNAVTELAAAWDAELARWVRENVRFVGTSIDRITPRATDGDVAGLAATREYLDPAAVVAEPFASWVLCGEFPAGRPRWEDAGAVFVDEIEPFENRKLWLLNGAHSLLAYLGQLRGATTVAEALDDAVCRDAMEAFWDAAERHLTTPGLDIPGYRAALRVRFGNPRIAHFLKQIAMDGSTKLLMRAVPVLQAERTAGRSGEEAALVIAAWIAYCASGAELQDRATDAIAAALARDEADRVPALLSTISPALGEDAEVVRLVRDLVSSLA
ncbi:mannitol dehydrogenase family protein [Micrococcales bacterium 31B]|nr:mannitol dehydrogenase family protein [Micrococcales bacterium 31B]